MMRLPPFEYLAPTTVAEAAGMLANRGPSAQPVGGGTDLFPNMKRRQVAPSIIVGLRGIPEIKGIRQSDEGVIIGAGTRLSQLALHPLIRERYSPLAEATLEISTPPLRSMGTVGGNLCLDTRCHFLNQSFFWRQAIDSCMKAEGEICQVAPGSARCWAITSADLPPLLIALRARVRLVSVRGQREIPLADLYRDDGIDYLSRAPDEILTEVVLPSMHGLRAGYLKLRRRGTFDFPALGVAAALSIGSDGVCERARIVLTAVTSRPLEMKEANLLEGEKVTDEVIDGLAEAIRRKARPLHLADYSHSYRKKMVAVYASRLLRQLTQETNGTSTGGDMK